MSLKTIADGRSDLLKFHPSRIQIEPGFNGRRELGDISGLAEDIHENGLKDPLTIRLGEHNKEEAPFLVDGERRLHALRLLIKTNRDPGLIRCQIESRNTTPIDRLFSQLSHNSGKPFSLAEKGRVYQAILDIDPALTPAELARRSQVSKQAVSNALTLVRTASPDVLHAIDQGRISPSAALTLIKGHDHSRQDDLLAATLKIAADAGKKTATPKNFPDSEKEKSSPPGGPEEESGGNNEEEKTDPDITPPSPPDRSALDRIKQADSTNRDGSTVSMGNDGTGFAKPEARIKNLETLLNESNPDTCNPTVWNTLEALTNYLSGETPITSIKKLLKSQTLS